MKRLAPDLFNRRFQDLMGRIPIHVITTRAALLGAAIYGLESLKDHKE